MEEGSKVQYRKRNIILATIGLFALNVILSMTLTNITADQTGIQTTSWKEIFVYARPFSVFDKGIITQHLKNGANLHQTAAIGETQSGGFFCDMAGACWGPPCFGYQGGPQQPPAILSENLK